MAFLAIPLSGEGGEPNKTPDVLSFTSLIFGVVSLIASQVLSLQVQALPGENSDSVVSAGFRCRSIVSSTDRGPGLA